MKRIFLAVFFGIFAQSVMATNTEYSTIYNMQISRGCAENDGKQVMTLQVNSASTSKYWLAVITSDNPAFESIRAMAQQAYFSKVPKVTLEYGNVRPFSFWSFGSCTTQSSGYFDLNSLSLSVF